MLKGNLINIKKNILKMINKNRKNLKKKFKKKI